MMKKVLITGANGYIGAGLVKELSSTYDVYAHVYPSLSENIDWLNCIKGSFCGDLQNQNLISEITEQSFDTLIHLVSLDHHQSNNNPSFVNSVNVSPLWDLLYHFYRKENLRKVIYFSTIHIYGTINGHIRTNQLPAPKNAYALSHLMAENVIKYYNENTTIDAVSVRLSNSYGAPVFSDANCWWLIVNDLCKMAFNKKKIVLRSDGSPLRDFIHHKDIHQAVKLLIQSKNNINIYNLSSGKTYSMLEIAKFVANEYEKMFSVEVPIFINETEKFENNVFATIYNKYTIDNSSLVDLGFKQQYNLSRGIREIFDYLNR
jgi:UDP-glucose 4-epimerase